MRPLPAELAANHATPRDAAGFEATLRRHCFQDDEAWFAHPEGAYDHQDQISARMERVRRQIVSWVSATMPLAGKRVLETGCGTGSSTLAIVEQKALLSAYDIDENLVRVARARARGRCATPGRTAAGHVRYRPHLRGARAHDAR